MTIVAGGGDHLFLKEGEEWLLLTQHTHSASVDLFSLIIYCPGFRTEDLGSDLGRLQSKPLVCFQHVSLAIHT